MNDDERKLLNLLDDEIKSIRQTLHGPPGYPDGIMSRLTTIEANVERCREENKAEGKDVRKAIRNLGFTAAGSVAVLIIANQLFVHVA